MVVRKDGRADCTASVGSAGDRCSQPAQSRELEPSGYILSSANCSVGSSSFRCWHAAQSLCCRRGVGQRREACQPPELAQRAAGKWGGPCSQRGAPLPPLSTDPPRPPNLPLYRVWTGRPGGLQSLAIGERYCAGGTAGVATPSALLKAGRWKPGYRAHRRAPLPCFLH